MRQPFRPRPRPLVLWTGFLALGAAVAVVGAAALLADLALSPRSARADAVVVAVAERAVSRGQRFYHPVLEFTADRRRVRFEAEGRVRNRAAIHVGEVRQVVYDPDDPADAQLDTPWRWVRWLVVIGLGLVLVLIGGLGRRPRYIRPGPPPEPGLA
jgi:hypothetical protein